LSIDPNNRSALNNKAFALANLNKKRALPLIQRVLESNSNNGNYLSPAALIIYNLKKYDEAKSYFEKALQINSNLTSILSEKKLTAFNKLMNNIET
jgi:tetratricopeptide (TPR) repeat protein